MANVMRTGWSYADADRGPVRQHKSAGLTLVLVRYQVLFDTDQYLNFVRYSILDTYVVMKSNFHIEHSSQ